MMKSEPTLLLLPGLLCDESVWQDQINALSPLLPVKSTHFRGFDSLTEMARAALALAEGPLLVAGHSMGARVTLEMFRLAPERIAGLALANTGVHPKREQEVPKRMALVKLAYEQGMEALADAWLPPMIGPEKQSDQALFQRLKQMVLRATPQQHEMQINALLQRPDPAALLGEIRCPVLVIAATDDQWSPVAQHEEIVAQIPQAQLRVIEHSGHMAPVEQPQRMSAILREWVQGL